MYITSSKFGLFGCFVNRLGLRQLTRSVGRVGLACRLCSVGSWQLELEQKIILGGICTEFCFKVEALYKIGGLLIMSLV